MDNTDRAVGIIGDGEVLELQVGRVVVDLDTGRTEESGRNVGARGENS
jgi:hypothetical protein